MKGWRAVCNSALLKIKLWISDPIKMNPALKLIRWRSQPIRLSAGDRSHGHHFVNAGGSQMTFDLKVLKTIDIDFAVTHNVVGLMKISMKLHTKKITLILSNFLFPKVKCVGLIIPECFVSILKTDIGDISLSGIVSVDPLSLITVTQPIWFGSFIVTRMIAWISCDFTHINTSQFKNLSCNWIFFHQGFLGKVELERVILIKILIQL